jgi:hypothetical protein
LGGSYSTSDRHPTAYGVMNGAELIATATEAELDTTKPRQLRPWLEEFFVNLFLSLWIGISYRFLKPYAAIGWSLVALVAVTLFVPVIAFLVGYRLNAISFGLGVLIEQLARSAEAHDDRDLLHEQRS